MKRAWWLWLGLLALASGVALASGWSRHAPVEPVPEQVLRERVTPFAGMGEGSMAEVLP